MDILTNEYKQLSDDYERIAEAIRFLETNFQQQPNLNEVASHLHLSEYHFQRLFTRWVGVSPKRYLQFLTKEHAKTLITGSDSLLDSPFDSGLKICSTTEPAPADCPVMITFSGSPPNLAMLR